MGNNIGLMLDRTTVRFFDRLLMDNADVKAKNLTSVILVVKLQQLIFQTMISRSIPKSNRLFLRAFATSPEKFYQNQSGTLSIYQ